MPWDSQGGMQGSSVVAALYGPDRVAAASDMQIAGLVPFSSVDWPGRLTATVFMQGCPWQCAYCQNPDLQDPREPGVHSWEEVAALLERRRGQLDGIVFTGGEPTRQDALIPAMSEAKDYGYAIGLHSAGPYPKRLAAALEHADWLGLDIKATPATYDDAVGRPGAGVRAWDSLRVAIEWGGELEVRLTVDPVRHTREEVLEIVARVVSAGGPQPVLQQARALGAKPTYAEALAGRSLADVLTEQDLEGFAVRA